MAGPSVSYAPSHGSQTTPRKGSTSSPTGISFAMPRVVSTPSVSTNSTNSSSSGIPKFRSLRSMLPFRPKQTSTSPSLAAPPSAMSTRGTLIHRRSSSSIPSSSAPTSSMPPPPPTPASDDEGLNAPDKRTRAFLTLGPRASTFAAAFTRPGTLDRSKAASSSNPKVGNLSLTDMDTITIGARSHSEDLDVGWRGNSKNALLPRASVDVANPSLRLIVGEVGNKSNDELLLQAEPAGISTPRSTLSDLRALSFEDLFRKFNMDTTPSSTPDLRSRSPMQTPDPYVLKVNLGNHSESTGEAKNEAAAEIGRNPDLRKDTQPVAASSQRPISTAPRPISSIGPGDLSTIAESDRSRELETSLSIIEESAPGSLSESTSPSMALARHLPPIDTSMEGLAPSLSRVHVDKSTSSQQDGDVGGTTAAQPGDVDEDADTLLLSDLLKSRQGQAVEKSIVNTVKEQSGPTPSTAFSPRSFLSPWSAMGSSTAASSSSRRASSYASASASPIDEAGPNTAGSSSGESSDRLAQRRLSTKWENGLADLQRAIAAPPSSSSNYSDYPNDADADVDTEDLEEEPPSFNLGALDPDLAELLRASANSSGSERIEQESSGQAVLRSLAGHASSSQSIPASIPLEDIPPPLSDTEPINPSRAPSPTKLSSQEEARRSSTDVRRDSYNDGRTSRNSQGRTLGSQSSPRRTRSRPTSLSLSVTASDRGGRGSMDAQLRPGAHSGSIGGSESVRLPTEPTSPIELAYGRDNRSPLLQYNPRERSQTSTLSSHRPSLARSQSALGTSEFGERLQIDLDKEDDTMARRRMRSLAPRLYATPARPSTVFGSARTQQRVASDGSGSYRPGSASGFRFGAGPRSAGSVSASSQRDVHTSMGLASVPDPRSPTPTRARSALGGSITLRSRARRYGESYDRSDVLERPGTALGASIGNITSVPRTPSMRTRKRSASAAGPDWTGRRTARAFVDAGLLDRTLTAPPVPRSSMGTPSGMYGGTELATPRADPWLASSSLGPSRGGSPGTTTTRTGTSMSSLGTMRRSGSTATSLSAGGSPSPPAYKHLTHGREGTCSEAEATISALRSKHAVEIEALVGALADAQRSSRELRTENARLHARVQILEDEVTSLKNKRNAPSSSDPSRLREHGATVDSFLGHRHSRSGSTEAMRSARITAYLQETTRARAAIETAESVSPEGDFLKEMADWEKKRTMSKSGNPDSSTNIPIEYLSPAAQVGRNRASTVSSGFPALPSTMSLLLHDEENADGPVVTKGTTQNRHSHRPQASSVSSVGSMGNKDLSATSPSILSLPGSSASLVLRPEHEKHLRDMVSLDFSSLDIDSD